MRLMVQDGQSPVCCGDVVCFIFNFLLGGFLGETEFGFGALRQNQILAGKLEFQGRAFLVSFANAALLFRRLQLLQPGGNRFCQLKVDKTYL